MYTGEVLKEESLDPEYKVKFSFVNDQINITSGIAIYTRQQPNPTIVFDDYTDYLIESSEASTEVINTIKLKIGETVCDFLFNK